MYYILTRYLKQKQEIKVIQMYQKFVFITMSSTNKVDQVP